MGSSQRLQAIQPVRSFRATLLATALIAMAPCLAEAQTTLIPVPDRRDHVYDPSRGILLITTSNGFVERYDVANRQLLSPFEVGVSLNGADISPDNAFLYVGEDRGGITQGLVRKVNLTDGTHVNVAYNRYYNELGVWDLALGGNGKGLVTTRKRNATGTNPLREIDLSNDSLIIRDDAPGTNHLGHVERETLISRSSDRTMLFLTESEFGASLRITYYAVSNTFIRGIEVDTTLRDHLSAVSRDGFLIAMEYEDAITIIDPLLDTLQTVPGTTGVAFHPTEDILFVGNHDEIIIYDTNTWAEMARTPLGEFIASSEALGNGVMSVSHTGEFLFVSTPSGVRILQPIPLEFESGFE